MSNNEVDHIPFMWHFFYMKDSSRKWFRTV